MNRRLASIDIGTNTVLLLIADVTKNRAVQPVLDLQKIIRLGKSVDAERKIKPEGVGRCISLLNEYRTLCDQHKAVSIEA